MRNWQGPRSQEAGEEVDYVTIPKATQSSPQCLRTALAIEWLEISVISNALLLCEGQSHKTASTNHNF